MSETEVPFRADRQPLVPPGQVEHHAADMTATFAADVPLAAAQARLGERDQWLPIDGDGAAPLGTLMEENSTGPLRLGYGAWRDLVLGCQFLTASGRLITAGGRTVKNVAGYDLSRFMVGQRRCFGTIVTVTTRTYRRPESAAVAHFAPDVRIAAELIATPLRPQWMVLLNDALLCGYLGDAATVEHCVAALESRHGTARRRTVAEDIAHRANLWKATGPFAFRAAVPPARLHQFVASARPDSWAADAAFGVVVGRAAFPEDLPRIAAAAGKLGGNAFFPSRHDWRVLPECGDPVQQRVLSALKDAFA